MIIESKIIAVILFGLGASLYLFGLMILSGVRKIDKEDRLSFGIAFILSLVLGYLLIIYYRRYTVMANLKATRKEFEDYVNLQRDGLVNMNEMDKVLRLTRLNQESYEDIINHYDEYVKAYPIKEFKYPPEDE